MLVKLPEWEIIARLEDGESAEEKRISLQKFLEVAIPRVNHSAALVEELLKARKALEAGETVEGEKIRMPKWTFRRAHG